MHPSNHSAPAVPSTLFDSVPLSVCLASRVLRELRKSAAACSSNLVSNVDALYLSSLAEASGNKSAASSELHSSTAATRRVRFDLSLLEQQRRDGHSSSSDASINVPLSAAHIAALRLEALLGCCAPRHHQSQQQQQHPKSSSIIPSRAVRQQYSPLWFDCVVKHSRKGWLQDRHILLTGTMLQMFRADDGALSRSVLISDVVEVVVLLPAGGTGALPPPVKALPQNRHSDPSISSPTSKGANGVEMREQRQQHQQQQSQTRSTSSSNRSDYDNNGGGAIKRGTASIIVRCRVATATSKAEMSSIIARDEPTLVPATETAAAAPSPSHNEGGEETNNVVATSGAEVAASHRDPKNGKDADSERRQIKIEGEEQEKTKSGDLLPESLKTDGKAASSATAPAATTGATPAAAVVAPSSSVFSSGGSGSIVFDLRFECSTYKSQAQLLAALRLLKIPIIDAQCELSKTFSIAKIVWLSSSSSLSSPAGGGGSSGGGSIEFFSERKQHDGSSDAAALVSTNPLLNTGRQQLAVQPKSEFRSHHHHPPGAPITISEDAAWQLVTPPQYSNIRADEIRACQSFIVTESAMRCKSCCGETNQHQHQQDEEKEGHRAAGHHGSASRFQHTFLIDPTTLPVSAQLSCGPFLESPAATSRRKTELAGLVEVSCLCPLELHDDESDGEQNRTQKKKNAPRVQQQLVAAPLLWESDLFLPPTNAQLGKDGFTDAARQQRLLAAQQRQREGGGGNRSEGAMMNTTTTPGGQQSRMLNEFPTWRAARRLICEQQQDAMNLNNSNASGGGGGGGGGGKQRRNRSNSSNNDRHRQGRGGGSRSMFRDWDERSSTVSASTNTVQAGISGVFGHALDDEAGPLEKAATSAVGVFPPAVVFFSKAEQQKQISKQLQQRSPPGSNNNSLAADVDDFDDEWSALKRAFDASRYSGAEGARMMMMRLNHNSNSGSSINDMSFGTNNNFSFRGRGVVGGSALLASRAPEQVRAPQTTLSPAAAVSVAGSGQSPPQVVVRENPLLPAAPLSATQMHNRKLLLGTPKR